MISPPGSGKETPLSPVATGRGYRRRPGVYFFIPRKNKLAPGDPGSTPPSPKNKLDPGVGYGGGR